jgi:hypothetical protein
MKSIRTGMRCIFAAFLVAATAHADSVVYVFIGIDNTGQFAEPEAFRLTVLNFIDPQADGESLDFTCNQLDSSTNCGSPGVIFSDQIGAFSAQVQFDAPIIGSIFNFPAGAFTSAGIYTNEVGTNTGTLTVQESPEPGSLALTLCALLVFLSIRAKRLRGALRQSREDLPRHLL